MVQDFEISGIFDRLGQRCRVIAFDRPGFGHTNRPRSKTWTPAAQAELMHRALTQLGVQQAIVVGHSWGTLVAVSPALDYPADVGSLVLLSGYYFPSLRADVLASSPTAAPVLGDLLSYTVIPLLGRALRSRVFRKLFTPAAVPQRFAAEFPTELALRPSQLKASASDTALMTPAAAALAERYDELEMAVIVVARKKDRAVGFARQSERLDEMLKEPALIAFENGPHDPSHRSRKAGRGHRPGRQPPRRRRPKIACRRRPYSLNSDSGLTTYLADESARAAAGALGLDGGRAGARHLGLFGGDEL
jgi:pimeloyl-ACP methyl ester carboxylesterase